MKKIQTTILTSCNVVIAGLLTLLGFSSCEKLNPEPKAEYGTPSAKFIVNGKIESLNSDTPIGNIRVVMHGDTTMTNSEGKFLVENHSFPTDQTFNVEFRDIDGDLNGAYEDLDTIIEFRNPKFTKGDGHWYSGEVSKEFNIKLTPKK